jgi:prepilin-type N-terminal cleavage/methylation domain-containing protein
VENWRKLIREKKGFTLIELIVVIVIIAIIAAVAIPSITRSIRRARFENEVNSIATLLEQARTQALASELDADKKVPPGGYGVLIDFANQKAILFIDDWNEAENDDVNVNYGREKIDERVLPDEIFTTGKDTALSTVEIGKLVSSKLDSLAGTQLDGTKWDHAAENFVTVIFRPPYAETTIVGKNNVELKSFAAKFVLVTENTERTIEFNRVTTTPQINLN